MTMHRLSAGAGYKYLLKHIASADRDRSTKTPLTAYYTDTGNPPGRWTGAGLPGVGGAAGLPAGTTVTEEAMANLFGAGKDPRTGARLGRAYPTYVDAATRIAQKVGDLPAEMTPDGRTAAVEVITRIELAKDTPTAVAGFDLTFTPPKSVSTLWAVADHTTGRAILDAHRAAVDDALAFVESTSLFTRTGTAGCEQKPTRGAVAACFDHWDSRAGDPNLHTHLVLANKVQTGDGTWLSVDSRALHHAVVTVSEVYDDLFADHLAKLLPVKWQWRTRGPRRSPAFELDGVDDSLMREFSTRTTQIDEAMTGAIAKFYAAHGRAPNRIEITRLRQQVTRDTRPDKHVHALRELLERWRARASEHTGQTPEELTAAVVKTSHTRAMTSDQVPDAAIAQLAELTSEQVMTRRSTWTRWNVLAEAARSTRALRMITPEDRIALLDKVTDAVLAASVSLEPPDLFTVSPEHQRPDGASVFSRPGEARYTDHRVLDAEARLLTATEDRTAPVTSAATATAITQAPVVRPGGRTVALARDQADAVLTIATSGRRLDVLVGPAGTGKTTTLAALKSAWERTHGRGTVIGLAPSSTAAGELAEALGITCENTAKWLFESDGPGAVRRGTYVRLLEEERHQATGITNRGRLRTIDTALNALRRDSARWTMRSRQLVVVDEASLAGTFTLDKLTAQATAAGAKVLLVGDHAQLSAVDAGGAFHLLAERAHPATLTSLWRFSHRWEAAATRRLRTGDARAIKAYADHDRITAGAGEVMVETAYAAWQSDTEGGIPAILLAADAHTVEALNLRAHNDRVTDGLVTGTGRTTTAGTVIGVGDRIVTRSNDRRLRLGHGYVRNGDLWNVAGTGADGSLTVTKLTRSGGHHRAARAGTASKCVVLPGEYVDAHVELGYATTTHRAQGITVDHTHVLASSSIAREHLYVAMSRGRHDNHVYVAVDEIDPDCDYLPDPHATRAGHDVLARILATTSAELSAMQTITARQNEAGSLKRLLPIRTTLLAEASAHRWTPVLSDAGLSLEQVAEVEASPARGPLHVALDRGAELGFPMDTVLPTLIRSRELEGGYDPARDIAAVLYHRVTAWLGSRGADPHAIARTSNPSGLSMGAADTLQQLDELIAGRIDALTDHAIRTQPGWLTMFGDPPDDAEARTTWIAGIAAYAARLDVVNGPTQIRTAEPPPPAIAPHRAAAVDQNWSRTI